LEYKLWQDSVFARDGYTCQKYGIIGGKIHAHHVLNFSNHPELRFAIDNGITLSKKAHKEFHHKYGIKNNTREQLLEFLNQI
jgi:5-methylcytosine-specific restriction endonuclease McrA